MFTLIYSIDWILIHVPFQKQSVCCMSCVDLSKFLIRTFAYTHLVPWEAKLSFACICIGTERLISNHTRQARMSKFDQGKTTSTGLRTLGGRGGGDIGFNVPCFSFVNGLIPFSRDQQQQGQGYKHRFQTSWNMIT